MPHESMSAYVDDLVQILEDATNALGCTDLKCPKSGKGSQPILWDLAEMFNGAGPDAADVLDRIQRANEDVGGSMGASWYSIGGGFKAAGCIGEMGPVMKKTIASRAYSKSGRDNNISFDGAQSLRMTDQSARARKHIKSTLDDLLEAVKNPDLKPSWAKTHGLYNSISKAQIALLN